MHMFPYSTDALTELLFMVSVSKLTLLNEWRRKYLEKVRMSGWVKKVTICEIRTWNVGRACMEWEDI